MRIIVLLRMVPDVVEELQIAPDGKSLDQDSLRMILSECDEHALEQALILKEKTGGEVIVVALDAPEVDGALYQALAGGADKAFKVEGTGESVSGLESALLLESTLRGTPGLLPADLILTGVQAISDLDCLVAPLLAEMLQLPYLGIVTKVIPGADGKSAKVLKEFAGGLHAEYEVDLPAVLGIQAAEKPPRYVPVAKVRAVMKSQTIASVPGGIGANEPLPHCEIQALYKPESSTHAVMLSGEREQMAKELCEVLAARGNL
jgi:electron transfer flavoprotein beta subunit